MGAWPPMLIVVIGAVQKKIRYGLCRNTLELHVSF